MTENIKKDEFIEIEGNDIFLKSFLSFSQRKIGEIGDSTTESIEKLNLTFVKFEEKVTTVFQKIEGTDNKGSFLVQLDNFKKQISEIEAFGDFETIFAKIEKYEDEIKKTIEANRNRNLEIKNALLEEAKILSQSKNWKKAGEEIQDLKMRWLKTGAVVSEKKEEIEKTFSSYLDNFYSERNSFFDNVEGQVEDYKKLIEDTKIKAQEGISNVVVQEMKSLQQQWKDLSQIPKKQYTELSNEFRTLQNDFFNQFKVKSESNRLGKNLIIKQKLIAEVTSLFDNINQDHFAKIKEIRLKWKNSGPVSKDLSEDLWDEFNYLIEKLIETQKLQKLENRLLKTNKNTTPETIKAEKTRFLKKQIRIEKESLEQMTINMGNFRINHKSSSFAQVMDSKTRGQERKLNVRVELLNNLK